MDLFLVGCIGVAVVLIVIVIIGSYHHVHKAGFKPKFVRLSDGSIQMEFDGFGGIQSSRTKRFHEEYRQGMTVSYQGGEYIITDIQEQSNPTLARADLKMVCYLEEKV